MSVKSCVRHGGQQNLGRVRGKGLEDDSRSSKCGEAYAMLVLVQLVIVGLGGLILLSLPNVKAQI